jgi:hypothetical protein
MMWSGFDAVHLLLLLEEMTEFHYSLPGLPPLSSLGDVRFFLFEYYEADP